MKANVTKTQVYSLSAEGVEFKDLRVASRWNDLVELQDPEGNKLIVWDAQGHFGERSGFGGAFDAIFGDLLYTAGQATSLDLQVLLLTPALASRFRAAGAVKTA